MYVYFPSCNFTRLFPELSEKVKAWMAGRGVSVTGCCRPNHKSLTDADTPIVVCETCNIIISENWPALTPLSIYEYLDAIPDLPLPDHAGETITVQDCYRAKERTAEKEAIRSLLRKMNYTIIELKGTEEEQNFDGAWLFKPVMPGNMKLAPKRFAEIEKDIVLKSPEEIDAYLKTYCERFTADTVTCYCNSCYSGLKQGIGEARQVKHMIEILFA